MVVDEYKRAAERDAVTRGARCCVDANYRHCVTRMAALPGHLRTRAGAHQ